MQIVNPIVLIGVILITQASAFAGFTDGNNLMEAIDGQEKGKPGYFDGFSGGYVYGVADASMHVLWCPPENVTGGQVKKIVFNYLKAHPEALHKDADTLVVDALKEPFPCKK